MGNDDSNAVVIMPSDLMQSHEARGVRRRQGANVTAGEGREDAHASSSHPLGQHGEGGGHNASRGLAAIRSRCGHGLDLFAIAIFLLQPCCQALLPGGHRLGAMPPVVINAVVLAGVAVLVWRLLVFRRWRDEHTHVARFLVCFLAMMVELTVENCVVWLVSAWDRRKYDMVPGLQDNVALAVRFLAGRSGVVRWVAATRWAHILHFLGALLALAFSVLWDQVPYSGFGIMARVVLTICCSRVLRMACFMCTVLPNPRPGCYARRFPPAPEGLWDTIRLGYTTIRGFGGCNDLIFSGHGAFWVLAPLAFRTYYPGASRISTWVLWAALAHTSLRDVLDEQHYSVDMLLAVVVTWAVWDWLAWVYPAEEAVLPRRPPGAPRDPLHPGVMALIGGCLLVAGVIVIGGKA